MTHFFESLHPAVPFICMCLVVLGVFLILIVVGQYLKQQRRKTFSALANHLHTELQVDNGTEFLQQFSILPLFKCENPQPVDNLIHLENQHASFWIFDFRYVIRTGRHRRGGSHKTYTYSQTVICVQSRSLRIPQVSLRPENILDKITVAMGGYQDIDFPENPTFSKRYLLKGMQEDAVRQLFSPTLLNFFEECPDCHLECFGDTLVFYVEHRSGLSKANDLHSTSEALIKFYNLAKKMIGIILENS